MSDVDFAQPPAFPMQRSCPFHPPAEYEQLRAESPVSKVTLPTGRVVWLIVGHRNVREVLVDPRVTSDRTHPNFPLLASVPPEQLRAIPQTLIGVDPPEHTAHRRLVIPEFTVKRVQTMRPWITELVDGLVSDMLKAGPVVDLVQAMSLPVPSLVICEMMGVPYADHDQFQTWTARLLNFTTSPEQRAATFQELVGYLDKLVTAAEEDPQDDLLGRLVVKNRESGVLDHTNLVGMARLLLFAGHETTANMISLGVVTLLEHPEQLAAVRADPALMPKAVEELLRYFSILDVATARVATVDMEVAGTLIRAGEGLIAIGSGANRDAEAFENPDDFDISRGARHHVAFGYGVHQCLGQNLARLELEIVLNTLFRRIPGLRLAVPVGELSFKHDANVYGINEVPVTW
ncbi:cytochrome P450 [Dactylosporangium sp. NPDC051541]|uniref:cytochrome P450 n=1 Tax=Dactylosporangium sp. NPDC051541 TaxID=3363977 RepID=UPI0037B50D6D